MCIMWVCAKSHVWCDALLGLLLTSMPRALIRQTEFYYKQHDIWNCFNKVKTIIIRMAY